MKKTLTNGKGKHPVYKRVTKRELQVIRKYAKTMKVEKIYVLRAYEKADDKQREADMAEMKSTIEYVKKHKVNVEPPKQTLVDDTVVSEGASPLDPKKLPN